ncbi:glycosyltransferase family 25 protein [Mesorhizobium xinjiangense]|uniref:glycosyltransferase family 25 protein n=1 Tax=Mesorhizobium xinjiangense TaxID=2678685 RepID=UPI0012EE68A2|nr:glycosyltransferase family 25 protein [Mesorhizobium xinjiangense]
MKVEALIIHLARATGRAPQVKKLLDVLPMAGSVVEAVDGQALSQAEIAAVYRPRLHRPRYPFVLRTSEVACFRSHRKAWQTILDRGLDAGLIIEDDVETDADAFGPMLDLALATLGPGDILRFPKVERREVGPVVARAGDATVVAPRHPGLGMQAQLVGREAARALLAFTAQFDRPVDTTVQMRWLHGVRVLTAKPVCIREIDDALGGTTIQGKSKSVSDILAREVWRPLYRLQVRMRNAVYGFDSSRRPTA